jgi:hypothetical protein
MKGEIDMKKFERDLQKFSKQFGDTSAQAVTRWGVQVARELAKDTFARGLKKGSRGAEERGISAQKQQEGAMWIDAKNVILVVDRVSRTAKGYNVENQGKKYYVTASKFIGDAASLKSWVEQHRRGRRRRTRKIPVESKKICTKATFKKYMQEKKRRSGIAKGAWVNAGRDLAKAQTGLNRVTISPSYLAYAQKSSKGAGKGTAAKSGFSPSATLINPIKYSGESDILSKKDIDSSIQWGLRKTLTWYKMAMRPKKSK